MVGTVRLVDACRDLRTSTLYYVQIGLRSDGERVTASWWSTDSEADQSHSAVGH